MKILGLPEEGAKKKKSEPSVGTMRSYSAIKNHSSSTAFVENADTVFGQLEAGREELEKARTKIEAAEAIIMEIASSMNMKDGELESHVFRAEIKSKERVTWNTEELEKIFHEKDKLPKHIKKSLRVDKDTYESLPREVQNILEPARIVNPQKPQIKVRRK